LKDITFKNIRATDVSMPIILYGSEASKVELTLENISISIKEGCPLEELIWACHYERISINDMKIEGFDGGYLIKSKGIGTVDIREVDCPLAHTAYVIKTEQDFIVKPI
jgi:hypothetical protein